MTTEIGLAQQCGTEDFVPGGDTALGHRQDVAFQDIQKASRDRGFRHRATLTLLR
jgi:hypothetical protein